MKILCLQDLDYKTALSKDLVQKVRQSILANGHTVEEIGLKRGDLHFCLGCLRCWSGETGICIIRDRMAELKDKLAGCDFILYISPVFFGTFSSTMKTLVDKGFGANAFEEKHYPQLIIGYGEALSPEERECFRDITVKHRGAADIVHPEISDYHIDVMLTRTEGENTKLCSEFVLEYLSGDVPA